MSTTARQVAALEKAHAEVVAAYKTAKPVYRAGISEVVGFGGIAAIEDTLLKLRWAIDEAKADLAQDRTGRAK